MVIESEKYLEKLLNDTVKKIGGWSIKLSAQFITGLPDRLCLLPGGRLFFAEIKTTKQKPKAIQLVVHRKLQELGFTVYLIDTSEQIKSILKSYENDF